MMSNPFFSNVVRIQPDRGRQVQTQGPHAHVRHPGYVGMIRFFAAVPFLLKRNVPATPSKTRAAPPRVHPVMRLSRKSQPSRAASTG